MAVGRERSKEVTGNLKRNSRMGFGMTEREMGESWGRKMTLLPINDRIKSKKYISPLNYARFRDLCYLPVNKDEFGGYHVEWQPLLEGSTQFFVRRFALRLDVSHKILVGALISFCQNTAGVYH